MKIQAALLRDELCRIAEATTQIPPYRPEFPVELCQRAVTYVLEQRRRGKTLAQCAKELGQPQARLHYWMYQRCAKKSAPPPSPQAPPAERPLPVLRPVQVEKRRVPSEDGVLQRRYILRSPAGWVLEELSLEELGELLRSLL